ncbi:MAG: hypothetical protein Q4C95_02045 [Planctomycetia bacterium]|nr:hypothetical protein [Planctomycetia bacterium]
MKRIQNNAVLKKKSVPLRISQTFLLLLLLIGSVKNVFPVKATEKNPTFNETVASLSNEENPTNDLVSPEFISIILNDWERQEQKNHRSLYSVEALTSLLDRAEQTILYLEDEELTADSDLAPLKEAIHNINAESLAKMPITKRLELYLTIRWALRNALLNNDLLKEKPIVFMKGNRFVCQMLHEYLGYYYQYSGLNGGGLFILTRPGFSNNVQHLTPHFPKGIFSTPSLSWDGQSLYFAFADLSKVQADNAPILTSQDLSRRDFHLSFDKYSKQEDGKFHLFKMTLDQDKVDSKNVFQNNVTQLTFGPFDDFDPLELPDGSLAFLSTRRGGYTRCNSSWEPLQVHTLHRLPLRSSKSKWNEEETNEEEIVEQSLTNPRENAIPFDNDQIQTLSWHETNEWHPTLLNDGRILYTRWDYVDRSAQQYHGLWLTNPDGTAASVLFGNYTEAINACYQAKAIPNSNKILFVVGGHHTVVGGSLVLLDPSKIQYDPETAEDTFDCIERLTPEIPFTETPNQVPDSYYFSPWPLSEDVYLVAYSHDPLGGMLSTVSPTQTGRLGLYYRDRFGNLELLYEDLDWSCQYPIPLQSRKKPPILPSTLPQEDKTLSHGTFVLSNVYESLIPFAENRSIKELRIFQLLPKFPEPYGNNPPIGHAFSENARLFLGTVPVEKDGSAHFETPANVPLYFQAVDENGRAVQTMRSAVYLQPGENRGCIGCHEQAWSVQQNPETQTIAFARKASTILSGPTDFAPFSYPRLIQPILDRACVSCHSSNAIHSDSSSESLNYSPNLTGSLRDHFTESYINLRPFLRWFEWGGSSIRQITTLPNHCGADESPLSAILNDENHQNIENFTEEDRRLIYLWLDANASFYGVYDKEEQQRQQKGERVAIPQLQ